MMPMISFRCPGCNARIRAYYRLLGQTRACPGCGHQLVVRAQAPEESGPMLVSEDNATNRSPTGANPPPRP